MTDLGADPGAERAWSAAELSALDAAAELTVSALGVDGAAGRPVPIWVVVTDGAVFVRTWRRRTTGWYGRAVRSGRARIRVPGVDVTVAVEQVGDDHPRAPVDGRYLAKYGGGGGVTTDEAAASTLRLSPVAD